MQLEGLCDHLFFLIMLISWRGFFPSAAIVGPSITIVLRLLLFAALDINPSDGCLPLP